MPGRVEVGAGGRNKVQIKEQAPHKPPREIVTPDRCLRHDNEPLE